MKKDTNIIVRVNSDIKERATRIIEDNGLTVSSIINATLVQIAKTGRTNISLASEAGKEENSPRLYETKKLIKLIKNFAKKNRDKYKIQQLYLFGSYARNEQTVDSDIDIHAVLNNEASLLTHASLHLALEDLLKKKVDVITAGEEDEFVKKIKEEEILIYG